MKVKQLSIEEVYESLENEPKLAGETKLSILWEKVRPFVVMAASLFGKKLRPYFNAFIAAIDGFVDTEDEAEDEDEDESKEKE